MNTEVSTSNQENAIESITRGETDVAIATAKKYPRSLTRFRQEAMTMATNDVEVAASCFYKLPRGGKSIEGPSVRLAEIVASSWGNMRFGARIVAQDLKFVTAQGVAHDLENNVLMTIEVRRRITDKNGYTFNEDMITVTGNAACSIALRNAIFKVVPFSFAKPIYEAAKRTAIGDAKTIGMRRTAMLEAYAKIGVGLDDILNHVGVNGLEEIGLKEMEHLIGVFTAIKDADTTIDEQFPEVSVSPEKAEEIKKAKKLRAALNKSLLACVTNEDYANAVTMFEADNGKPIWASLTHVREKETFGDMKADALNRIETSKKAIIARIKNAGSASEFDKAIDDYKKHSDLETHENIDLIHAVGKALGIDEYADKD